MNAVFSETVWINGKGEIQWNVQVGKGNFRPEQKHKNGSGAVLWENMKISKILEAEDNGLGKRGE